MEVRNKKLTNLEYNDELKRIRSWYRTGREVDLDEAVDYHKKMSNEKNLAKLLQKAKAEGRILIGNRFGFATDEETIEAACYIRDKGGCDFLGITTDTYTRRAEFDVAEKALEESKRVGRSLLNGFPASLYGVKGTRRVYEIADLPISSRHGASTPQFHYLIALAAGAAEANIGVILDGFCSPGFSHIRETLRNVQFTARMVGWYEEHGVNIVCQSEGYAGSLYPPYLNVASIIIEMLLAAEQGVIHHDVMYAAQHCIAQDVAALKVLSKLADSYLKKYGYHGNIITSLNTFQEVSPPDQARTLADILLNVMSAKWGGAARIMGKSADEGLGMPSKEGQAMSMRAIKAMLNLLGNQQYPEGEELKIECEIIERGTKAILDKVLDVGDGDLAIGTLRALEAGILDFPFSPSRYCRGKLLVARDTWGAVRVLEPGNLPISKEMLEYDREKLTERRKSVAKDYQMIVEDVMNAGSI